MSHTLNFPIQHIENSEKAYYCPKPKRHLDGFGCDHDFNFMVVIIMAVQNVFPLNLLVHTKINLMPQYINKQ